MRFWTICPILTALLAPSPRAVGESEPNNQADQANPIQVGKRFSAGFDKVGDRDYFKITAPGAGALRLTQEAESKTHQWAYPDWQHAQKNRAAGEWAVGVQEGEEWLLMLRSSRHSWDEKASAELMRFSVTFEPNITREEPNDAPDTAPPRTPGNEFSVQINPRLDRDHFKFTFPDNGTFAFRQLTESKTHGKLVPSWHSGGKWLRDNEATFAGRKGEAVALGLRSARHSWDEKDGPEVITIQVDFQESRTDEEPNDTLDTAKAHDLSELLRVQMNPRLDRDYVKLRFPANGVIRLRQPKESKTHGTLWPFWHRKGQFEREGEWDIGGLAGEELVLGLRSARHGWDERASDELVTLNLSFEPDAGMPEPNGTAATASKVAIGREFEIQLNPRVDRDFVTVRSPGRGVIRLVQAEESKVHGFLHPWWMQGEQVMRDGQWDLAVEAGQTVVLGLRSAKHGWDERPSPDTVKLQLLFAPEISKGEPNDTPLQAEDLPVDEDREFSFKPRHDHDFFRVRPGRDGVLEIQRVDDGKAFPHMWSWWQLPDGSVVREGLRTFRVRRGQDAVFGVRGAKYSWDETASDAVMKIRAVYLDDPDASEPNDLMRQAVPLTAGVTHPLSLFPEFERDCFLIKAEKDGALAVQKAPGIQDRASLRWQPVGGGEPVEGPWTACRAGDKFVLIVDERRGRRDGGALELTIANDTIRALGLEPPIPSRRWTFQVTPKAD